MKDDYLSSRIKQFEYYKLLGDKAMAQLKDDQLLWQYNLESNSVAMIVNHIAGNMRSLFTDFLRSDGEKSWRNRDSEFDQPFQNRSDLIAYWN